MAKRIITSLILCITLLCGCMNELDNALNQLERRIANLESRCNQMNSTIEGLRQMVETLESHDFIKSVDPLYQGGRIIGYTITFTHAAPITVYNGTDAETPLLGVAQAEDGLYYWTVKYPSQDPVFVTDNFGQRIPTNASTPRLKIENGNWMVTYDNGETWTTLGRATGEDGASFFRSVINQGDYAQFNLLNGTTIELPYWDSYTTLYNAVEKANKNLESFQALAGSIQKNVYADNVLPIVSGRDTVGYSIHLSDGTTWPLYNGTGTNVPVISARPLSATGNEVLYWAISYGKNTFQWILDENGKRIQANAPEGQTVKLTLLIEKGRYYWGVAYGDADAQFLYCDGKKVEASTQAPEALVRSVVEIIDGMVRITLADGQTIDVPMRHPITVNFGTGVSGGAVNMAASDTVTVTFNINPASDRTQVLPIAPEGFYSTAASTSPDYNYWRLDIISPATFTSGSSKLNLLVSDGTGAMRTIVLTIKYKKKTT